MCHVSPFALTKIALARSAYLSLPRTRAFIFCLAAARDEKQLCTRVRQEKGFGEPESARIEWQLRRRLPKGRRTRNSRLKRRARKQPFSRREFNLPPTARQERENVSRHSTRVRWTFPSRLLWCHFCRPEVAGCGRIDGKK